VSIAETLENVTAHAGRAGVVPVRPARAPSLPPLVRPAPGVPLPAPAAPYGAHESGTGPVNAMLAGLAVLAALMFAGFVRLRTFRPVAPSARILVAPG
jgi:hypothetical protein